MSIFRKVHVLAWCIVMTSCSIAPEKTLLSQKGIVSIPVSVQHQTYILEGEWAFYPKQLLNPQDFRRANPPSPHYVSVPDSWTNYRDARGQLLMSAYGTATYSLDILLPKDNPTRQLGLYIPKIWSAAQVWVNDELVMVRGKVNSIPQYYENETLEEIVPLAFLPNGTAHLRLVVQVANHDLFVGGLLQNFKIGRFRILEAQQSLLNGVWLMWLGCLVLMGVYHLVLYLYRTDRLATLLFAIACGLVAMRIVSFGEHYFYEYLHQHTTWWNITIQSKIYYIAGFALIPVALRYVAALYPKESNTTLIRFSTWFWAIFCGYILVVPVSWFINIVGIFEGIALIFQMYLILILIWAVRAGEEDARWQAISIGLMILAGVNDALHSEGIAVLLPIEFSPITFALVLILQIFIIARRFTQAFNEIEDLTEHLEEKVELRTIELQARTVELQAQKELVEKAHQEIHESINYAKRIQQALLPSSEAIRWHLPEHFIFFRPRDVVSGDFYWSSFVRPSPTHDGLVFIIAADCTGHGIPGALMSMIGINLLNEIIDKRKISDPSAILKELNHSVQRSLHQIETRNNDGMDLALVMIDLQTLQLHYADAKNPLVYIQNGLIERIKADKTPIGGLQHGQIRHFTTHTIDLDTLREHQEPTSTSFYIFSDGFQDQFGGEQKKKFSLKRMEDLFLAIHHLPMQEQHDIIAQTINAWMQAGQENQIDDMLIIGGRIVI